MAVTRVFDRLAAVYDTPVLQGVVYRPIQDRVVDAIRPFAPSRVLDVGCGTGVLTGRLVRELAPRKVYGCDPSRGMLAAAAAKSPTVEWLEGTAEAIPLPASVVDAVVSTTAFHFFDQPAALREFARVLAPGGVVAIGAAIAHTEQTARLFHAAATVTGTGHVPSAPEMRQMCDRAGLAVLRQVRARGGAARHLDPMMLTLARKPADRP